jgi:hypothetical protein
MNEALTAPKLSQRSPMLYWLALAAWVVIALLCVALFWVDLVADYYEIIVPCTEGVPGVFNDCNFAALTPAEVSVWTSWGLSLQTYGIILLSGATFTFLVYTTLAAALLWHQRQSWLGLMISLALIVIPYAMFATSRDFGAINPNLIVPAAVASFLGNGIMILFLYLVPNGRFSPRWAYIPMLATFLLLLFGLQFEITDQVNASDATRSLATSTFLAMVLFGGSLQLYRYLREANAVERQQTKWIILGVVIFVTAIIAWVLVFGRALPIPAGQPRLIAILISFIYQDLFAIPFLPIAITIAILRYRLWGIDVIVRKTLVYLLLSGLLALVYFGIVILLQSVFGSIISEQSPVVIVISTLVIAALFAPLRKRVQTAVDRRFYRQKYDAQQVLAQFAQVARDETEMEALTAELIRVVQETMQPESVSFWLKPMGRYEP